MAAMKWTMPRAQMSLNCSSIPQMRMQAANTLTLALLDPEQRTQMQDIFCQFDTSYNHLERGIVIWGAVLIRLARGHVSGHSRWMMDKEGASPEWVAPFLDSSSWDIQGRVSTQWKTSQKAALPLGLCFSSCPRVPAWALPRILCWWTLTSSKPFLPQAAFAHGFIAAAVKKTKHTH